MSYDEVCGTALYRLFDSAGTLLYVGIGSIPAHRWRSHRAFQEWWLDVKRAEVIWFDNRAEVEAEELRVIADEKPLHNVVGTFKRMKQPTRVVPLPSPHVTTQDIADATDLSNAYVRQFLTARSDFPAPCGRRGNRRIWLTENVAAWIAQYRPPIALVESA